MLAATLPILEGKRDAEFRKFATRTHAALARYLEDAQTLSRVMRWNGQFMAWAVPATAVYAQFAWPDGVQAERIALSFSFTDAYRAIYRPRHESASRPYAVLEISVDEPLRSLGRFKDHGYADPYGAFIDPAVFPLYVAACWSARRVSIVHELIHVYDRARMTDPEAMDRELKKVPGAMKSPGTPFFSAYFGTNHEYNAHVQTLLLLLDDTPAVSRMRPQQIVAYIDRACVDPASPFATIAAWWKFVRTDPVYKQRVFRRIAAWRPGSAK